MHTLVFLSTRQVLQCQSAACQALPLLPPKAPPRALDWDVALIRCGSRVPVRRREERMLRGLWVFPMTEGHRPPEEQARALEALTGLRLRGGEPAGEARHVFTHQVWRMRLFRWEAEEGAEPLPPFRLVTREELEALPLPAAMRVPRSAAFGDTPAAPGGT